MASAVVDEVLQDLASLTKDDLDSYPLGKLRIGLRHMRTFLLFASKWHNDVRSKSDENSTTSSSSLRMGSFLNRLEDSLVKKGKDFHNLCLVHKNATIDSRLTKQTERLLCRRFESAWILLNCIDSFREGIAGYYITFSDCYLLQSKDQSLEFFDSLQVNMADIRYQCSSEKDTIEVEPLKEKLLFFKNFIHFAQLRGFEPWQLQLLFTHLQVVAANVARLCYEWTFLPHDDKLPLRDEFQLKFSELLLKTKPVDPQIRDIYVQVLMASKLSGSSRALTPGTDRHVLMDFVDSLLYNILEALKNRDSYLVSLKDQVPMLYEGLTFLRRILANHLEKIDELHEKVKDLIGAAVNEAAIVICSLPVHELEKGLAKEMDSALLSFLEKINRIKAEINLIKMEALRIDDNRHRSKAQNATKASSPSSSQGSISTINRMEVTLDDEKKAIIGQLTRGSKQLDIISVVGMPGLGKTHLARSVYDDPSVRDHFRARAWCVISQAYEKKDSLLQLLGSVDRDFFYDHYSDKNECELEERLRKCLLRRRYLIILDDVWDIDAWNDLDKSFPHDANSSRILLTTRHSDVAKKINPAHEPHSLRLLTDEESWHLLREKLSCRKSYPLDLGMKIAKNCKGLPLTIIIVAGILANLGQDDWIKIAKRLSLRDLPIINQCKDMLEVSYKMLPENLRSCLLYFAALQEDAKIPCKKLIWLWNAEGFVQKCETKSVEDVAKDYLNDLIGRSMVMVSKERSIGGARTCGIHDLLREFCVVEAKEEKFMSVLSGHDELFNFYGQRCLQRLCIHSTSEYFENSTLFCPSVRSLLFVGNVSFKHRHISFMFYFFKLLRVLSIPTINLGSTFPSEIALLVELRYLAVQGDYISIPPVVANLSDLEALIVYAYRVHLPATIWNLSKLRVLQSPGDIFLDSDLMSASLENLDTFSTLIVSSYKQLEEIMRKLPNVRILKCRLLEEESEESNADCKSIVVMDWLSRLESLHLGQDGWRMQHIMFRFPLNIKKLSLSRYLSSIIPKGGELPNLVVLKLDLIEFEGDTWDMNEEWEFPKLKLLEMKSLEIVRWTGSDDVDHFPCLEKLLVERCNQLEEVPSCLGGISTLQMIEVRYCGDFAASLFQKIKEEQNDLGNDIQVHIEDMENDVEEEDWRMNLGCFWLHRIKGNEEEDELMEEE